MEQIGDYIIREYWDILLKRIEEAKKDESDDLAE